MKIVSNTSPITNLAAIGQFQLLRDLFERILIPEAVLEELNANGTAWPGSGEVAAADWILLDEADGRYTAKRMGLQVVGVAGILMLAKQKRLIDQVMPLIGQLRHEAGFYLSDSICRRIAEEVGEAAS